MFKYVIWDLDTKGKWTPLPPLSISIFTPSLKTVSSSNQLESNRPEITLKDENEKVICSGLLLPLSFCQLSVDAEKDQCSKD